MEIFIQRLKTIIAFNFTFNSFFSFFFSFLCVIALPFFSCAVLVTSCCCLYHLSADDETSNVLKRLVKNVWSRQCIVITDVYINSGITALLWSLVDFHFMLFLYDREDLHAYCCHEEEWINFQSLFFPIKTNEKRNARVLREISKLALSCIACMYAYSVQSYTIAIIRSCTLFTVCTCY